MYTVDVVIPTYKPDRELFLMLDWLTKQTVKVGKIIIMNTEEKYFDQLIYGTDFLKKYANCEVYHHSRMEFDHGKTRGKGVSHSSADYFVMLTQDAMPKDEHLIANLIKPLVEGKAAVSYGRQLPKEGCGVIEQYTRSSNYPKQSMIKTQKDVEHLGIKTYFCSDVCAAYNRQIFDELGGFIKQTIFNEDMIYACKAAKAGYGIAYCADACVYHSHNYTAKQQYHRNFDIGVSQADHPEVFEGVPSEGEGIKMVKQTMAYLWQNGHALLIPKLVYHSGMKWLGYRKGKRYQRLTDKQILKATSDPIYWRRHALKTDIATIDATKGYGNVEA